MLRFTIRDILWLTAVVGLSLGWWLWWRSIPQDARLSGSINVAGQPLPDGRVLFCTAEGQICGANVTKGRYRIHHIPAGRYKLAIEGTGVDAKYRDGNYGLSVEVRSGTNQFDIGLAK